MTTIKVNYGAMTAGHEGLVSTWGRIESHLAELDSTIAATGDMRADALDAYRALKARWSSSADDRQRMLRALADSVENASQTYRHADAAMAAQFVV